MSKNSENKELVLDAEDLTLHKKIIICKWVGEGSDECNNFKEPMWCLNTLEGWRNC